ncbi:MAG: ribonuclease H [Rectinemataceae bacterium]|jgi:ribonuclease HI
MDGVIIYTDGGCSGNPGPGGWAFVIRLPANYALRPKAEREVGPHASDAIIDILGSGGEAMTTNNRMELRAVIASLAEAERRAPGAPVVVNTDSQYVKNGITSWIASWKRNGWRTSDRKPVKNRELWEELDAIAARVKPTFLWVEGHAGVEGNERCDAMVQEEIAKFR